MWLPSSPTDCSWISEGSADFSINPPITGGSMRSMREIFDQGDAVKALITDLILVAAESP
jgi:hypothetical protein